MEKRNTPVFPMKPVPLSETKAKVQLLQRYTATLIFVTSKEKQVLSLAVVTRKHGIIYV